MPKRMKRGERAIAMEMIDRFLDDIQRRIRLLEQEAMNFTLARARLAKRRRQRRKE